MKITIDRPTTLRQIVIGGKAIVSFDPTATVARNITAPTTELDNQHIFIGSNPLVVPVDIQLTAGENIFLSAGAAGNIALFFVDP